MSSSLNEHPETISSAVAVFACRYRTPLSGPASLIARRSDDFGHFRSLACNCTFSLSRYRDISLISPIHLCVVARLLDWPYCKRAWLECAL